MSLGRPDLDRRDRPRIQKVAARPVPISVRFGGVAEAFEPLKKVCERAPLRIEALVGFALDLDP
jgi:hypothetical protein